MHTAKTDSTSIRLTRKTREALRELETELGLSTGEAVDRAIHSLRDELKWKKIGEYYDANPELDPEDEEWLKFAASQIQELAGDA